MFKMVVHVPASPTPSALSDTLQRNGLCRGLGVLILSGVIALESMPLVSPISIGWYLSKRTDTTTKVYANKVPIETISTKSCSFIISDIKAVKREVDRITYSNVIFESGKFPIIRKILDKHSPTDHSTQCGP